MSPDEFRRIALSMKSAVEGAHMGHPDFRANGKIFATLHPGERSGIVKLTPDQQQEFLHMNSEAFAPASGAWGRQGSTMVSLDLIDAETLGQAMTLAWQNVFRIAGQAKPKRAAKANKPFRKR